MGKQNGKNSKNLSGKYNPGMLTIRQKLLDRAKPSATDAFKTALKIAIKKAAEVTSDLIGNKIANKITEAPKNSQKNYSEGVMNKHDKEIHKDRHISPEGRQEILMS